VERGLGRGLVPVEQPAEPLVEPGKVEKIRRSKGLDGAGAPEAGHGGGGIGGKLAAHALDPNPGDVRSEPVEALDAH
jgi:hypothetical protein